MSCDNLQGNGDITRKALCAFADLRQPVLRRWIEQSVACPNSMVDRITPSTTEEERTLIQDEFGVRDGWPVVTEPFRQWVLEDIFCNGRPAWEEVGAVMTHEVEPYEVMKMRLLNGTHFAMAYFGAMLGLEYVHEVLEDRRMRTFIVQYMEAVTPAASRPRDTDLSEYKATLLERFSNPTIRDQIQRICSEGSSKIGKFVLPVASILLRLGEHVRLIALVVASWLHTFRFKDQQGHSLPITDVNSSELKRLMESCGNNPAPALALRSVFSEDIAADPIFRAEVGAALASLWEHGPAATLDRYGFIDDRT
jgi:mannitol 2-dehydrogenase